MRRDFSASKLLLAGLRYSSLRPASAIETDTDLHVYSYWEQHLQGRPYHISALYVVDLDRFRQIAAGDRLRQQYQALSADPHSLANLDQDLPK